MDTGTAQLCANSSGFPQGFYVYLLVDPRDSAVFYVGKGQGARAWQHQRDIELGKIRNARKAERIQQIIQAGLDVEVIVLATYPREADALEHERRLVDELAGLTNVMPGGIGRAIAPELIVQRRQVRKLIRATGAHVVAAETEVQFDSLRSRRKRRRYKARP